MDADRWRRIEQLYHAALELETGTRAAFLEQACGGDEPLRREVASLLKQTEGGESFLEAPAMDVAARALAMNRDAETQPGAVRSGGALTSPPSVIGRYRIIRLLGEGGMGAVYEAEQEQPRRVVALKVIRPGFCTPEALWRFEHEAQALGRLQHPGIAQIYEAGTADTGFGPQPYFAMELIRGESLMAHVETHRLDTRQRLALMARICDAVQHAHQRGLIHRDLKPGNILVDDTGQPKILDFGVARMAGTEAEATRQTSAGQIVGTLSYMSPEQVLADPLELDTRSDVYSLGVILYELLSGRLPYNINQGKLHEALRTIREDDPAALSSVSRIFRGDIETIAGKALEKDKARRYASAADLSADIQRFLGDEPITARPPSAGYQIKKFARRHRALVGGMAAVFVVLVAGIVASTSQAIRADRAGRAAIAQRDRATAAEKIATSERNRAVEEKKRADQEAATANAISSFLQDDLLAQASARGQSDPNHKPDPDLKVRTALDRAAARIAGKFEKQPLVEASLRETIGRAYDDLGLYPEAQHELERSAELRRRELGEENPETLDVLDELAGIYLFQGKYAKAEPMFSKGLKIRRRILGEEDPATLRSMKRLAVLYYEQAKYPAAEPLLTKSLAAERRILGEDDPETLDTMHDLAELYEELGRYAQAEASLAGSLEIKRRVIGAEHPDTLATMAGLARIYELEDKYPQAEPLFSSVLEIRRRTQGENHPDTIRSMNNLAVLYRFEGKLELAEPLQLKTLEIQRRILGPEHADTITSMNNLAVLYRFARKYAESEALLTKILEIGRRTRGAEHTDTLLYMYNLAVVYRVEGKYAEAEAVQSKAAEVQRRVLGTENPYTLRSLNNLAMIYRLQAKYAQAEPLAKETLAVRSRVLGAEHSETLVSMNELAALDYAEGNGAEAEALWMKLLQIRRRINVPAHPDTLEAAAWLAEAELRQKKYGEAEGLLREAVAGYEKTAADSWQRYRTQAWLGAALAEQSKYAEAEPLLISGYEGMLQRKAVAPFEERPYIQQAGDRLVRLYESWGKPAKASEWREKLGPATAGQPL